MLTQRTLTTIHLSALAESAGPALMDPYGLIQLLDDAGESAPSVHWLVRLGGGESRAVDMRARLQHRVSAGAH